MSRATNVMRTTERSAPRRTAPMGPPLSLPRSCRRSRVRTASRSRRLAGADRSRLMLLGIGGVLAGLAARRGGRVASHTRRAAAATADARAALEAAGCTLERDPGAERDRTRSRSPTVVEEVEHRSRRRAARTTGSLSISGRTTARQPGAARPQPRARRQSPSSTGAKCRRRPSPSSRAFVHDHTRGTVLAPLSRRSANKIALGAWVHREPVQAEKGTALPREVHRASTSRRSRRSSRVPVQGAPSGSRPTRCCPARSRGDVRSVRPPGWRNGSDAPALKAVSLAGHLGSTPSPGMARSAMSATRTSWKGSGGTGRFSQHPCGT